MPIRILIVDDSHVMRAGFRAALAKRPEFEVVGEAADGDEVVAQVTALRPDLVVLDVEMKRVGGIEAARRLEAVEGGGPKILMSSLYADDHLIAEVLRAGAMGYVLKTCLHQDLASAVERIMDGGQFVSRKVAVLEGVAEGYHPPRIAAELKRRLDFMGHRLMDLLGDGVGETEAARQLGLSATAFESLADETAFRFGLDSGRELIGYVRWDVTGRGVRQSQAGAPSETAVA